MSIGMILLVVISLLILFGVLQRVLDRMALTDRQALTCVAAIFVGGWLPDIPLGSVYINIGGALIPIIICVYLFLHAGMAKERIRTIIASALTTAAVYAISVFFPADPVSMPFDPQILYGLAGGVIAWILGRSRRGAFIAGVLGVTLADLISGVSLLIQGIDQPIYLGGAGALDAAILSGITAVLMCELIGEIMERISRKKVNISGKDSGAKGAIGT